MVELGRNTFMPEGLNNVKRPHPVTYLIILFFGYYGGMKSHGSWEGFFILVVGFFISYLVLRILKHGWDAV